MQYQLRDTVDALTDMLGCTRQQASRIVIAARRDGYPDFARATEAQGGDELDGDNVTTDRGTITVSDPTGSDDEEVRD